MRLQNLFVLCAILFCFTTKAQNQQGWLGPERDGIYPESGLLKEWTVGGPKLIWETLDAGKGYSSPVIVGDHIYLTGMNEDETKEVISMYSLQGEKIFTKEYGTPWSQTYPETRTTPAIVGDKIYVISGMGEVVCMNKENGDIIWSVTAQKYGQVKSKWGISECPLVFDNKIIFGCGGDETAIVALDADNGELIWKSPSRKAVNSYASPILINHNGTQQIIALTGDAVVGIDPNSGEFEWVFDDWGDNMIQRGLEKIAPNTPRYYDGKVFFSNGYDMNSFLLKLNSDASAVELLWSNTDFDTHLGGYILLDGTLYGSNWINNSKGHWCAVDWNTGETLYEHDWGSGKSKGEIVSADNMLYIYDEKRGYVGLLKPNPSKFDLVSEFRITKGEGPHWAYPVIKNGVLYIRHGNALMAYDVKL